MKELVTIRSGDDVANLAPGIGGSVAAWWRNDSRGPTNWLRPALAEALASRDVLGMASFPLVPFSGRIRDGHFALEGHVAEIPPDPIAHPHALHGLGWRSVWTVEELGEDLAVLAHAHDGSVWPWPYLARQTIAIAQSRLEMTIDVTNLSDRVMPAGIGHHPYFPRTPEATITAGVEGRWIGGPDVMPVAWEEPPAAGVDPSRGIVAERVPLDTAFAGWNRAARIDWPERRASLTLVAEATLPVLIVYTPPGEPYFCVEPVSHTPDAVNMRPGPGVVSPALLGPGETLSGRMTLTVALQD